MKAYGLKFSWRNFTEVKLVFVVVKQAPSLPKTVKLKRA